MQPVHLILLFLSHFSLGQNPDIISRYEEGINKQIESSLQYEFPENAYQYKPNETSVIEFGTFDFIVIGSGATGSVMANRLSEVSKWKVLLLEAGNFTDFIQNVTNMRLSFQYSDHNWAYTSVPQTTACLDMIERRCQYPRGKGIGGTTLINGLVYARGNKKDFDKWASQGNPGWSYDEVLSYFKKSENFEKNLPNEPVDAQYHGKGGYLDVEYHIPRHPLSQLWLEAHKDRGYKILDYNGKEEIGASQIQQNTRKGQRLHAGNAFINPVKARESLRIMTKSYVTKIIIQGKKATGVKFSHNGQYYLARVKKEVILSAGAIASPQLLMLSGIGPKQHLQSLGIEPIEDLEVGSALKDHTTFYGLAFDTNFTKTHNPLKTDIKDFLNGRGFLTVPDYNENIGFYQSKLRKEPNYPDLEFMMVPLDGFYDTLTKKMLAAKEKTWRHLDQIRSIALYVVGSDSRSVGTIRLKSKDPFEYPLIDSRFLSDPEDHDINLLYEGIKIALGLFSTETFRKVNATLHKQNLPACEDKKYLSKEYWFCALRYFTYNLYHPVGTCPMGPDPRKGAVVDREARVYGVGNLRVADASIFPFTFAGHPVAPCTMVGEKVADLIKKRYL